MSNNPPTRRLPRKVSSAALVQTAESRAYSHGFAHGRARQQELATQAELAALGLMANYYTSTCGF